MTAGSLATVVAAPQRFTPRGVPTLIVVAAGLLSLGGVHVVGLIRRRP